MINLRQFEEVHKKRLISEKRCQPSFLWWAVRESNPGPTD